MPTHQCNVRIPPEDWAWLRTHPGITPQIALRALAAHGRQLGARLTIDGGNRVTVEYPDIPAAEASC